MSVLTKFFSIVLFGGFGFVSIQALGMTTTNTDELYAESINMQRSSAEIPSSIDSNNANAAAAQEDYVVESVSDLDNTPAAAPAKKISAKSIKTKKASRN